MSVLLGIIYSIITVVSSAAIAFITIPIIVTSLNLGLGGTLIAVTLVLGFLAILFLNVIPAIFNMFEDGEYNMCLWSSIGAVVLLILSVLPTAIFGVTAIIPTFAAMFIGVALFVMFL